MIPRWKDYDERIQKQGETGSGNLLERKNIALEVRGPKCQSKTHHLLAVFSNSLKKKKKSLKILHLRFFPSGTVGKNPSANAGHMDSILAPGRFHLPWSN